VAWGGAAFTGNLQEESNHEVPNCQGPGTLRTFSPNEERKKAHRTTGCRVVRVGREQVRGRKEAIKGGCDRTNQGIVTGLIIHEDREGGNILVGSSTGGNPKAYCVLK